MIIGPLVMTWIFGLFTKDGAAVFLPGAPFLLAGVLMVAAVILFVARTRAPAAP
jgi:DHA1 family tetracycline resistance protein-like MFS transporter